MSLFDQAEADRRAILEDPDGFGVLVDVTGPSGQTAQIRGSVQDIAQSIDPDTGLTVSGRQASVVFSGASIRAAGIETPSAVSDNNSRPWVVRWTDAAGTEHVFKIADKHPDQTPGADSVTYLLEAYSE